MSRRELGSLALVSFLLVGGFYYAKFSYLNAPDSRALLAQTQTGASGSAAPAQSTDNGDRTECKGGETLTVTVGAAGVTSSGACNLPTNTCKVIVNAPDKPPGVVTKCCRPEDGRCLCEATMPCDKIYPIKNVVARTLYPYAYKCTQSGQKSSAVRVESQLAAGGYSTAEPEKIDCNELNERVTQSPSRPPASPPRYTQPVEAAPPGAGSTVGVPPAQIPAAQAPARPVGTAFNNQPPASTGAGQPTGPTGPSSYAQIQAEAGRTGALPGQTGQATFPGQTQTALNPATTQPGSIYRPPGYVPPVGAPLTPLRPDSSMQGLPRAQTTFGNPGFSGSQGSGGRVAGSFISGIASLIGGLFSVPTNAVVTYIQSFVGPVQPTRTIPSPARPQNPAQVPVLPYPVPPAPTSDIYAQIRAIANQGDGAPGASGVPVAPATQDGTRAPDVSLSDTAVQSEVTFSGKPDEQMIVKPKTRAEIEAAFMEGTRATTTESTSTPTLQRREPDVVEIGVAVDITDLATYESILAYINGDWAHVQRTALQNKAALAQAEVQQDAIRAQIEALQDARAANICDDSCAASLTVLQNELPMMQSRVDVLQATVRNDAAPHPSSPPPTVFQLPRIAESLAEPTYQASIPRSAAEAPTAVSVYEQEALPEVPQTESEATVTRVVSSIWNFLKSWFLPPATESAKPRPSCSLFASLFGKCK